MKIRYFDWVDWVSKPMICATANSRSSAVRGLGQLLNMVMLPWFLVFCILAALHYYFWMGLDSVKTWWKGGSKC